MKLTSLTIMLLISFTPLIIHATLIREAAAQARTETNCNVGMLKGQTRSRCEVPILPGCTVAQRPGFTQQWAEISKGGATHCYFDEQQTDWQSSIVGTCETCTSDQCSARFSVMLNCASPESPPSMQQPAHE